jgi:hypothetical protein
MGWKQPSVCFVPGTNVLRITKILQIFKILDLFKYLGILLCMRYTYSKHFIEMMIERCVSEDEITMVLLGIVDTVSVPSKKDKNVILVMGFVADKGIVVILNSKTRNLITVRKMRKDEKKLFEEV